MTDGKPDLSGNWIRLRGEGAFAAPELAGLVRDRGGWFVLPHRVVEGFELPPTGSIVRAVANIPKIRRFRKTAARERARRTPRR